MARKSIDFSQSLLQFQSQARNRNERLNRPSLLGSNSPNFNVSRPSKESNHCEDTRSQQAEYQENQDGTFSNHPKLYSENEVESLRTKFSLQNKSLARSNSVMLARINEMETTVSDLINENMRLKKSTNNSGYKQLLEDKLGQIESNIVEKVSDLFQFLKGIREREGLGMNPQLDSLDARPSTSTPIDTERCFPSFNLSFGKEKQRESPEIMEKTDTPEGIDLTFIETEKKDTNERYSAIIEEKSDKFSTIIEEESDEKEVTKEANEPIEVKEVANESIKPANEPTEPLISETVPVNLPKDLEISSNSPISDKSNMPIISLDHNSPTTPDIEYPPKSTKIRSKRSKSQIYIDPPKPSDHASEETLSRPRRARNVVDYKGVSLRAKMRRESANFVDAVGENAMINYGVVKNAEKTERDDKGDKQDKSRHRKPLGNVTNTSKRIKLDKKVEPKETKSDESASPDGLSVFDFENESTARRESVYIGKRTAKRNRRHTLMM